ncbi:MAG: hypothetical protein AVDCRST_MAG77-3009, partial [uncultured Chloroflexi bacterium]
ARVRTHACRRAPAGPGEAAGVRDREEESGRRPAARGVPAAVRVPREGVAEPGAV